MSTVVSDVVETVFRKLGGTAFGNVGTYGRTAFSTYAT
jgi:hypothetical protein